MNGKLRQFCVEISLSQTFITAGHCLAKRIEREIYRYTLRDVEVIIFIQHVSDGEAIAPLSLAIKEF